MFYFLNFVCVLQKLVLPMFFGDYCFALLIVSNHQILWLFYMSLVISLYLFQLNSQIFLKESGTPRYYRHKVRSTDLTSLLDFRNPSVLQAQGRKYRYELIVGVLKTLGGPGTPSVLPIRVLWRNFSWTSVVPSQGWYYR
jgi:hypothetical protein